MKPKIIRDVEEIKSDVGNKNELVTSDKSNLVSAMNELFTNVSNGKDLISGTITGVDDSVVIPTNPTFSDLVNAISGISTGKKWASGNITSSPSYLPFTTSNDTVTNYYPFTVSGLSFKPNIILINHNNYHGLYAMVAIGFNSQQYGYDLYQFANGSTFVKLTGNAKVFDGGFTLPSSTPNTTYKYIAFE